MDEVWTGRGGRAPAAGSASARQLMEGLGEHLGTSDVRMLGTEVRPEWFLIDLLVDGERRLFAKLAREGVAVAGDLERPRLVPVLGGGLRLRSEAESLRRLSAAISPEHRDLAAIEVVHWQDSPPAMVVEWVDGVPLSRALGPLPGIPADPGDLLRKAGRWLKLFHSLGNGEEPAYRYPDGVFKWLGEASDHLGPRPRRWGMLVDTVTEAVERNEGLEPQMSLHHGDMAPRNLMVRPDGRLVGIDAGVEWSAPSSHDVAVFLTDLRLRAPRRVLKRVPKFVAGYGFRPTESYTSLIFSGVALLDRRLAWLARTEEKEGSALRRSVEGMAMGRLAGVLTERMRERMR